MDRNELHYADCDYCPHESNYWSVVVDEDGEIERLECEHCGGTGWERGMEALPS